MKPHARLAAAAVLGCLFISGLAGLIYEVVWARYLALFLGHTSYAVLMVLTTFMGGLALGGWWLGKRADRTRAPLAMYGWLEIGIGAFAVIFPWYDSVCYHAYLALAKGMEPGSAGLLVLKLLFSFLAVILPTVLMGGTLPVLTKFVTRSLSDLRERVAVLYATNSGGAVMGCLLSDFWLIPSFGLEPTVFAAAAMNLAAGAGALVLHRVLPAETTGSKRQTGPTPAPERFSRAELRLAIVAIGVSGFVAMLYEVAWTRLLALAMGSSTHAFSVMLTTFIAGLALGAWIIGRWRSLQRTLVAFAWVELALAATLLVSLSVYEYLPFWFAKLAGLLARREEAYAVYAVLQAAICFAVMIVPTVCLGMTLPLVSRVAAQDLEGTGAAVGLVYSVNTVGTVLGAVMTGLWLLPWLGLARTFALGAAANAIIGLVILARKSPRRQWLLGGVATLGAIGLVWAAGLWFQTWPLMHALGLWRKETLPATWAEFRQSTAAYQLRFYRDGAGSTVSVNTFERMLGREDLSLRVNGKADAGTSIDMPTQILLGQVPMLLHPEAKQALVVGLGSGITCSAVAAHPSIERIDAIEISPEVVQAARVFESYNHKVLDDARLHVVVDDAKSFLQIAPRAYDVIISEPSNPWVAGVAGVFTTEFYESCRARLKPGGLMTQWVQVYETNDRALDIVLHTFTRVFPHTSIWRIKDDLILVGSIQPQLVDLDSLARRFHDPKVEADLERIGVTRPALLLGFQIISSENGAFVAADNTPMQSDYSPVLEYVAQRSFFARGKPTRVIGLAETETPRPGTLLARYLAAHPLTPDDVRAFVAFHSTYSYPSTRIVRTLVAQWQQLAPNDPEPVEAAAQLDPADSSAEWEAQKLAGVREALWQKATTDPTSLRRYHQLLWQSYRTNSSAFHLPATKELQDALTRLIECDRGQRRVYELELAKLAWDRGDDKTSIKLAFGALDRTGQRTDAFDLNPDLVPEMLANLAEAAARDGALPQALQLCQMGVNAQYTSPRLEMISRKIQARPVQAGTGAATDIDRTIRRGMQ